MFSIISNEIFKSKQHKVLYLKYFICLLNKINKFKFLISYRHDTWFKFLINCRKIKKFNLSISLRNTKKGTQLILNKNSRPLINKSKLTKYSLLSCKYSLILKNNALNKKNFFRYNSSSEIIYKIIKIFCFSLKFKKKLHKFNYKI